MAKPSNNRGAAPTGMALLRGVLVGLLVAALVLTGACFALPPQDAHDPRAPVRLRVLGREVGEHGVHAVRHERRRACGVRVVGVLHLERTRWRSARRRCSASRCAAWTSRTWARPTIRACGRPSRPERTAARCRTRRRCWSCRRSGSSRTTGIRASSPRSSRRRCTGSSRATRTSRTRRRRTCARASSSWAWTRRRRPPRTATPCSTRSTTWRARSPTT